MVIKLKHIKHTNVSVSHAFASKVSCPLKVLSHKGHSWLQKIISLLSVSLNLKLSVYFV